ncbi:SUMF1/EgtB/PvdO family nonheme iron enzyme [uncultured Gimesia sp.]|uniref:SUMF1/EgtB/PvdO family nonheme iron enzyme n=1 Tax=uncultured Gimesia sp. TaxID=1678688 RepID=UPI0030DD0BEE|tara:strand:- start:22317 stop:26435 length:4119 start_codon:yes stop_codon:yes gene_type:complete
MTKFDPYQRWLGIPPQDQPPHFYRLLGLELFEENPEVIKAAADNATAFIQQNAFGEELQQSQRLLKDIKKVAAYLLSPPHKAKYDTKLKAKLGIALPETSSSETDTQHIKSKQSPKPTPSTPSTPLSTIQTESPSVISSLEQPQQVSKLKLAGFEISYPWAAVGTVGFLAVAILLGTQFMRGDSQEQASVASPSPTPDLSAKSQPPKHQATHNQALAAKANKSVPNNAKQPEQPKPIPVKPKPALPPPAKEFVGQFTVRADAFNKNPGKQLANVTVDVLYQPGLKKEGRIKLGTFKTNATGQGELKVNLTPKQQTGKFLVKLTRENKSWERNLDNFPNELTQSLQISVKAEPEYLNPKWMEQRLTEVSINDLIAEYRKVNDPVIQTMASALDLSQHILEDHPEALREQLQLRLFNTQDPALAGFQILPNQKIQFRSEWPTFYQAGGPLIRTISNATGFYNCLALTPDGKYAVTGKNDRLLRIWDLSTGNLIRRLKGHTKNPTCVAVTPDGKRVVSGSSDKTLKVWDFETGKLIQTLKGHPATVSCLAVSPDGKRVISGDSDKSLNLWDLETGELIRTTSRHKRGVSSVAISPDGKIIFSSSSGRLILSDYDTGKVIRELKSSNGVFHDFAVTPDGKLLITGGSQPKVWDLKTGRPILNLECKKLESLACLAVSPNRTQLIAGMYPQTLMVYDMATGKQIRKFKGHADRINSITFLPDGNHFVSSSLDTTLKLWNLEKSNPVPFPEFHSSQVNRVAISPNGKQALSGSSNDLIKVWDLQSGKLQRKIEETFHHNNWISYLPDERFAISGSGSLFMGWDLTTGTMTQKFDTEQPFSNLTVSPDGSRGITETKDKRTNWHKIYVWDLTNRKRLHLLEGHEKRITCMAVSADGSQLFSGSDNELKVWDLDRGRLLHTYQDQIGAIRCLALSLDGKYALTSAYGDKQCAIQVWNLKNQKRVHLLKGHTHGIQCLAVSPDGTLVASYAPDHTIRLWDLIKGELLATYHIDDTATDLAIGPDNRTVLVGSASGSIHKLKIKMPGETPELQQAIPLLANQTTNTSKSQAQQASLAKALDKKIKITNSLEMHFALIPAGKFMMGSGKSAAKIAQQFDTNPSYFEKEHPQHEVQIEKPFYMGMHEVTIDDFKQFVKMTGYKTELERSGRGGAGWDEVPQKFRTGIIEFNWVKTGWLKNDFHPVVNVSWNDAVSFCEWLSRREKAKYRLPTEAEWEYACRAGTTSLFHYGNAPEAMTEFGNIWDGSANQQFQENYGDLKGISAEDGFAFTSPVGSFKANPWSLYDMHGNVREWCSDWLDDDYYQTFKGEIATDPQGPNAGSARVLRSGCWSFFPQHARAASRSKLTPSNYAHNVGFRVVLEIE